MYGGTARLHYTHAGKASAHAAGATPQIHTHGGSPAPGSLQAKAHLPWTCGTKCTLFQQIFIEHLSASTAGNLMMKETGPLTFTEIAHW